MPRIKNTIEHNGKRKVCRIFDNGGATVDRYTIAFKQWAWPWKDAHYGVMVYPYIKSSENPFHPQGVRLHDGAREFVTGKHLGKRVAFDTLPVNVKTFILNNI